MHLLSGVSRCSWATNTSLRRSLHSSLCIVLLQWLYSVAVVIFCCGGYILLLWLYSVAVVIFCCSGYILLQWLYSVAVVIFCQRDYFRMKLTCSYTSQCYSTYSSYSLISLLKFLPCLHHPSTPPTNTTFLPEPFEGILEQ